MRFIPTPATARMLRKAYDPERLIPPVIVEKNAAGMRVSVSIDRLMLKCFLP